MEGTMGSPTLPAYPRPEPLKNIGTAHDYPQTSFLEPSTPGYSDTDWKTMAVLEDASEHGLASPSDTPPQQQQQQQQQPISPRADSFATGDSLHKHLLVETAMFDSSRFDILAIDEVDALKKEKIRVDARIEGTRRKLALESKVRDAARSLHRLYSQKGRPQQNRRKSLLGDKRLSTSSTKSDSVNQASDELATSDKKVEELVQILVGLENRRQYVESRLLRHTAAVLQAAHHERETTRHSSDSLPHIRDYDQDVHSHVSNGQSLIHNSQLNNVNTRLQFLNGQMRSLISQAKKGRQGSTDDSPDDIPSAYPEDEEASIRIDTQLEQLQDGIFALLEKHKHSGDAAQADDVQELKEREQEALEEAEAHRKRVEELEDQMAELENTLSEHQDEARIANIELQHKDSEHQERLDELVGSINQARVAKETAEASLAMKVEDMEDLESEVIRLTTELAMAKAELDGAYGSRLQRAKEMSSHPEFQELAQKSKTAESRVKALEAEMLTLKATLASVSHDEGRMRVLEKELGEMAADYQEITRETVEMEKEREKLESTIDALRDKMEGLEQQLGDERVRWLGVKSPAGTPDMGGTRETTSTMVLRNEFKRMMRETRAEGIKLLRVSYDSCMG
jgi:predicted  nucleic acid-binding Zn-ribbon protein